MSYERRYADANDLSVEHGLPTVGACVACATPPVDNPATVLTDKAAELSP